MGLFGFGINPPTYFCVVKTYDHGSDQWVYIHVEIQGQKQSDFAEWLGCWDLV